MQISVNRDWQKCVFDILVYQVATLEVLKLFLFSPEAKSSSDNCRWVLRLQNRHDSCTITSLLPY